MADAKGVYCVTDQKGGIWGGGYLGAKRREIIRSLGKWRGHNKLCETGSQEVLKWNLRIPLVTTNKGIT